MANRTRKVEDGPLVPAIFKLIGGAGVLYTALYFGIHHSNQSTTSTKSPTKPSATTNYSPPLTTPFVANLAETTESSLQEVTSEEIVDERSNQPQEENK